MDKSNRQLANMSEDEKEAVAKTMDDLYRRLADLKEGSPASEEAQAAIKEWYDLLNSNFGSYSLETFKALGRMYVDDERFTENIDRYGEGLAKFMCEAMAIFAEK